MRAYRPGPAWHVARRGGAALALAAALARAPQVRADELGARIEWEAPDGCPGALELHEALRAALGDDLPSLGGLARVRGSVVRSGDGFRLALGMRHGEQYSSRVFEAASCEELTHAAVLAITLAVAPERGAPTPPAPEPEASPADRAPPAPPVPAALEGVPPEREPVRALASVGGVLELGALPDPALGLGVAAGARFGLLSFAGFGVLLGGQELRVGDGQRVELSLMYAGARGCHALLTRAPRLDACLGFELGRFEALGLDLAGAQRERDLWLAPSVALEGRFALGGSLALELRGELAVPLGRKQYTINESDTVHAPAALSGRLQLGLSLAAE